MDIYLSVTAEDYPRAAAYGSRFAFVAYGIGPDGALLRRSLPILPAPRTGWERLGQSRRETSDPLHPMGRAASDLRRPPMQETPYTRESPPLRRNLLSLTDRDAPAVEQPEVLCGYVSRECARRGYAGAALDFEGTPRDDLCAFAVCLSRRFGETGRRLYVPESYADAAPESVMLLCTALSGGNFEERLREAVEARGGDRLALDVQRLRMDFSLPARTGEGEPLDAEAFRELSEGKSVYFSPDLCARYFTFTQGGAAHFVLFDDADTINRKLDLGRRYGVRAALLQWPEIADIAGELRLE
ncbi:MAG: hypothetical protein IJT94_06880 [Oscillibacter sp.]|nr:hypothetical protein [Oscillibacter sp.]